MKESRLLRNIATDLGLSVQHTTEVIAREGKEPNLCLLAFGLRKSETINSKIIILDTEGQYTMEYRELTREFYLDF
jgi:tRNA1Val (adenine37-N6)-methyltransferase